jgi:hypothetical protein
MRGLVLLVSAAWPVLAEPVTVPSGQPLEFMEAFWDVRDEDAPVLRLRFVAREIGTERDFAAVEPDFIHLCRTLALPRLPQERRDSLIVINLSDRPVPFGASDPEATQYFEAFRAEDGDCRWEGL